MLGHTSDCRDALSVHHSWLVCAELMQQKKDPRPNREVVCNHEGDDRRRNDSANPEPTDKQDTEKDINDTDVRRTNHHGSQPSYSLKRTSQHVDITQHD